MSTVFEGDLQGKDIKIGVVVARFNEFITGKLLSGAKDALSRHGVVTKILTSPGSPVHSRYLLWLRKWPAVKNTMP